MRRPRSGRGVIKVTIYGRLKAQINPSAVVTLFLRGNNDGSELKRGLRRAEGKGIKRYKVMTGPRAALESRRFPQ